MQFSAAGGGSRISKRGLKVPSAYAGTLTVSVARISKRGLKGVPDYKPHPVHTAENLKKRIERIMSRMDQVARAFLERISKRGLKAGQVVEGSGVCVGTESQKED